MGPMMIHHICPTCEHPIHSSDSLSGLPMRCPSCRSTIDVPSRSTVSAPAEPEPVTNPFAPPAGWSAPPPPPVDTTRDDKLTAKWRGLMAEHGLHSGDFPVLAVAEERPSILLAVLLSPVIWALLSKVYVAGFRRSDRTLCLFRVERGLFSACAGFGEREEIPLDKAADLRFRHHLLTSSLGLRDHKGRKRSFAFALPSRSNSKLLYEAVEKSTRT
jgi:hypothetical protein